MGSALRSLGSLIMALLAAVLIAVSYTMTAQIALAATSVLIMGGAGHSLGTPPDTLGFVNRYVGVAQNNYVLPVTGGAPNNPVVVITPEARLLGFGFDPPFTFRGLFDGPYDKSVAVGQQNLNACITGGACDYNTAASGDAPQPTDSFIVYSYSQSSTISTFEKRALAAQYPSGEGPTVLFLMTANGNRPNGGLLSRGPEGLTIPIAGMTFSGPTPTDTQYQTIDISRQYDGWADQPLNPLNLLADLNVIFGLYFLHQHYDQVDFSQAILQDQYGDTSYYLVPTPILPLLMPLEWIPVVGHPLADVLDPPLRVLVEAGYDRTISPGQPTQWNPFYIPNPVKLGVDLLVAIPTGVDNGIEDVAGSRLLGTVRPGPYGVGGPPVTMTPTTNEQNPSQPGAPAPEPPVTISTVDVAEQTQPPSQGSGEPEPATSTETQLPRLKDVLPQRLSSVFNPPATQNKPQVRLPIVAKPQVRASQPRPGEGVLHKVLSGLTDGLKGKSEVGASTGPASAGPGPSDPT